MKDQDRTREQLTGKLEELHQQVRRLESLEIERGRVEEELRRRTRELDERVRELNCLFQISRLVERRDISREQIFQGIVDLLPPAWQYPEITCSRIIVEGQEFKTGNFRETIWKQARDISVHGERLGTVEVAYLEERPERDEGPFQNEEGSLLESVAERLGRIIERHRAEEALQTAHDELERQVAARTAELARANEKLRIKIEEQQRTDAAFRKTYRALRVLSQCNNALVHAVEESALLQQICRIIVETGEYRLAWVGFAMQDASKSVLPAAQAGYEEGYLDTLNITWEDTELGRGPTGTAIRTGTVCIARDIPNDPNFAPWRTEAIKRGYASSISLPLIGENRVFGALNIYAIESDAFDEEECELLTELANNFAFGIVALRTRIDRRKAERARRTSEARYRAIVEDQTELICRHLPDKTLTFVNDAYCRYFGKKRKDLIGRNFLWLILDEDRDRLEKHFSSLTAEHPVATIEHPIVGPEGEIRWQQWTNRMILDEHKRHIEFQSVGRDTTKRKMVEEALEKSTEKIKFFAYSISHDLRSPAIGIYGMTQLLHKHYKDYLDEKGKDYCDKILRASEHVAALIEKINTYVVAKEAPLKLEKVHVGEVLQMVRDEFSSQLVIRQIEWFEPDSMLEIVADRLSLLRVFRNFIDNALKYGGDDLSEIRIGHEESEDFHIFSVSDDGAGIRNGDYERIFALFQRDDTCKSVKGAGLGLAIVREIAERHKGRVWAEPGPVGGTTFYISLAKDF